MSTAVLEPGELRLLDAVASLAEDGPVAEALARLGENERRVIRLRYWQDWTLRRIAEHLGLSHQRVSQIHAEALERLRPMLSEYRDADA